MTLFSMDPFSNCFGLKMEQPDLWTKFCRKIVQLNGGRVPKLNLAKQVALIVH